MEYNRLLELMFYNRGYSRDFIQNLNVYDRNAVLQNVDDMCRRLRDIHDRQERVVFLSDFDMDGIMSGVIGYAGLSELGFVTALYMPRPERGYGFDATDIELLLEKYPDTKMVITGDVGITCHDGIKAAKDAGLEVIVTDHHKQESGKLPPADCIVDPMQDSEVYPFPYICGAHVIYQCLSRYADAYCDMFTRSQIRRLRVFAGIGTVSDSMQMLSMNRPLVEDAIAISRLVYSNGNTFVADVVPGCDAYRRSFKGLYFVLKFFADIGKIKTPDDINEQFFGYYMAPMFNSVKRIGAPGDMGKVFNIFFNGGEVSEENVKYLFDLNNQRKMMVDEYMEAMNASDQPYAPYLYFSDAPGGILGLLATKQMEATRRPCLVVREDNGRYHGSGRSFDWYPFLDRNRMAPTVDAKGHNEAFGIKFDPCMLDSRNLRAYIDLLHKDVMDALSTASDDVLEEKPDFVIAEDGSGDIGIDIMAFVEFVDDISRLKPFGPGFPAPNIKLKFHPDDGEWAIIGSTKAHLKIRLGHGLEVLCWNQSEKIDRKDEDRVCEVWGNLSVNEFNNNVTVQFSGNLV